MADLIPHYQSHQLYKHLKEVLIEYSRGCSNTWETHNPSDCDECLEAALRALLIRVKDWLESMVDGFVSESEGAACYYDVTTGKRTCE